MKEGGEISTTKVSYFWVKLFGGFFIIYFSEDITLLISEFNFLLKYKKLLFPMVAMFTVWSFSN